MSKYVLITGGTKGIGKAVARVLAEEGYNLIITYAGDESTATQVKQELIDDYSITAYVLNADISSEFSIDVILEFLTEKDIRLFSLIFNAGLTARTPFEQISQEEWLRVFYANVHFPVFLVQRILPLIEAGGNVVFTGSLMGIYPHSVSLSYGVTKSAVHALVQNLVKFLSPYKIRVNGIAPGFVDTDWQKNKPEEIRKRIENKIALGRFCEPEELAEVYKLIINNSYLNGEVITVSGGYSYN